nr:MAG TPA: hypothetical protein [Caudoviricetes sp.]
MSSYSPWYKYNTNVQKTQQENNANKNKFRKKNKRY